MKCLVTGAIMLLISVSSRSGNWIVPWYIGLQWFVFNDYFNIIVGTNKGRNTSVEKTLIRTLLDRYEKFGIVGRPVNNSYNLITVNYGLALIQILDLDENKQVLRTNCWSRYTWKDSLLQWNPHDYANVTHIRVFPELLWTPDIKLYNFADERLTEHRVARVVIQHDGLVIWIPQALFKSTCSVEITYFPFDKQECVMEFGSWTYDKTQLDLKWWGDDSHPYIDFTDYVASNEWETDGEKEKLIPSRDRKLQTKSTLRIRTVNVTNHLGEKVTKQYPILQYRVSLKRNPSFYVSILVIPCILLSCLTLVLFWLPPESPAKMMLGMNIFVAFFVLLLLLAESTPSAVKNFPLIGGYYCLNMILITLSTFLAVIVINLYFRGDRRGPVPFNVRRIFIDGLGTMLYVRQNIPLPSIKAKRKSSSSFTPKSQRYRPSSSSNHHGPISCVSMTDTQHSKSSRYSSRRHFFQPTEMRFNKYEMSSMPDVSCHQGDSRREPMYQTASYQSHHASLPDWEDFQEPNAMYIEDSPVFRSYPVNRLEEDVREIRRCVKQFVARQKEKDESNLIGMEWRTVALVLDRLFFCLYLIAISAALIIMFPRRTYDKS